MKIRFGSFGHLDPIAAGVDPDYNVKIKNYRASAYGMWSEYGPSYSSPMDVRITDLEWALNSATSTASSV